MKRLALTYKRQRIISAAFNFKAYRAVYEIMARAATVTRETRDAAGLAGVVALFDGTVLTEEILRGLTHGADSVDSAELMRACGLVYSWYLNVRSSGKPDSGHTSGDPLLSFYKQLVMNYHFLPDEVDRQDPQIIFDIFTSGDTEIISRDTIPPELWEAYGLD